MNFAAIDVGSNAIRLKISSFQEGILKCLYKERTPIRLGQDVFDSKIISEENVSRVIATFQRFEKIMQEKNATKKKAIATSAVREAINQVDFKKRLKAESGIPLSIIDAKEEARLIQLAVNYRLDLENARALSMDIGGGSVEIIALENMEIKDIITFPLGTVRTLVSQDFDYKKMSQHIESFRPQFDQFVQRNFEEVDVIIGTGGNVDYMGTLRTKFFDKRVDTFLKKKELKKLLETVAPMNQEERIQRFGMRQDRADVIVPAMLVVRLFMESSDCDILEIPRVGLKEGVIVDLVQSSEARSGETTRTESHG